MIPQLLSAVVGLWLMAAPAVLGYGDPAATADRIIGPLVATFALIAAWGVTRSLRWANVAFAVWLLSSPVFLGHERVAAVNSLASAVAIGALSLMRGRVRHPFGGGWSSVWRRGSAALR